MSDDDLYKNDAWKKLDNLYNENTKTWEPRVDLQVVAVGCERTVMIGIGYPKNKPSELRQFHSTQRNVGTMREFAQAILDACDFVEKVNPQWAKALPG